MQRLEALGWTSDWAAAWSALDPGGELFPARVAEEHRGALRVLWRAGELRAEISGRLRYTALSPHDLPGVGDWVTIAPRPSEGSATVHHLLPRRGALVRRAPERPTESQLLAANVDCVLVVTSANRDFRERRLERLLALARDGGAEPVVVLSKSDVAEDLPALEERARTVAAGCPVLALSALTGEAVDQLTPFLGAGRTLALLGSSGVGKSTLANRLAGVELATQEIRAADGKGRHTTTHRQLVPLPGGGVLIDTPGLREVGLWSDEQGVDSAFPDVEALLTACRFHDCGHESEPGCALQEALADGRLDPDRYASYQKLQREVAHLETRRSARARHEKRKKMKAFAKTLRQRPDKRRPR